MVGSTIADGHLFHVVISHHIHSEIIIIRLSISHEAKGTAELYIGDDEPVVWR